MRGAVPGVRPKNARKINDYSAVRASSPEPAVPAYSRLRMHRKRPQVLGVDLNRSESIGPMSGWGSKPVALVEDKISASSPKPDICAFTGCGGVSLNAADRGALERAGGCQPANRRGIDGIGPRHVSHRLACGKALQRLLALMRRHLAGAAELDATVLRPLAALARPGTDQLALELG